MLFMNRWDIDEAVERHQQRRSNMADASIFMGGHSVAVENAAFPPPPTEWTTYRNTLGGRTMRVVYHPSWDSQHPWVSYVNGTAGRHFNSIEAAQQHFPEKLYRVVLRQED